MDYAVCVHTEQTGRENPPYTHTRTCTHACAHMKGYTHAHICTPMLTGTHVPERTKRATSTTTVTVHDTVVHLHYFIEPGFSGFSHQPFLIAPFQGSSTISLIVATDSMHLSNCQKIKNPKTILGDQEGLLTSRMTKGLKK